jgi:NAD(P)H-flavin reductase
LIEEILYSGQRGNYGKILIIYGARTPADLVYKQKLEHWQEEKEVELKLTVDAGDESWKGPVGFVPSLLMEVAPRPDNAIALTVGPPIMIKFVLQNLMKLGFSPDQVFTNLENRMKCGIGKCGRCNIGPHYVCTDGPVFSYQQILQMPPDF